LKDRLIRATSHIRKRPDPLLEHVDEAFFRIWRDIDDEESLDVDEIVVRDAFLEFMQSVMSGYKECLKDPGENATEFSHSKVFFEFDKFLMKKDALNKQHHFINRLVQTTSFGNYIECRSLGRSEFDP
jgi:Ribonuclease G/E